MLSQEEQHEYLCSILEKLIDSELTASELQDLASALGIKVDEFYPCTHYSIQKEAA